MLVYMFPGQGSQYKGMGNEFFKLYPKECQIVSDRLGYDIVELCLNDKSEQLNNTLYTQPAIFFVSVLHYRALHTTPNFLVGHSLGLLAALYAADVITLEDGIDIVAKRAELMSNVNNNGSMLAVIGCPLDKVEMLLVRHEFHDIDIANDNSDSQIVLSGIRERLLAFQEHLNHLSYRSILLAVSGAFHSRYMSDVLDPFFSYIMKKTFHDFKINIISSTHGEVLSKTHLLEELTYQIVRPVRWRQVVRYLKKSWPQIEFKEVGPGDVLTKLNQHIN